MTVRDKVGRVRYIAFRSPRASSRGAVAALLPEGARLTRFDGSFGIVRTDHERARDVAAAMRARGLETLATSGTIRAAARRLPPEAAASKRTPRPDRLK
jgi:hypothetical protein